MSQNANTLEQSYPVAELSDFIKFHGSIIFTYQVGDTRYIPIKPISDTIGIDWRNIKRNLNDTDNQHLYGVLRISAPIIDNLGGHMTPQTELNNGVQDSSEQKSSEKSVFTNILCIRFDRVQMFLARVNTSRVRSNGNVETADFLLKLQVEWAEVLHQYEHHGIAIKKSQYENTRHLKSLVDIYKKLDTPEERSLVLQQIKQALGNHQLSQDDLFSNL